MENNRISYEDFDDNFLGLGVDYANDNEYETAITEIRSESFKYVIERFQREYQVQLIDREIIYFHKIVDEIIDRELIAHKEWINRKKKGEPSLTQEIFTFYCHSFDGSYLGWSLARLC